ADQGIYVTGTIDAANTIRVTATGATPLVPGPGVDPAGLVSGNVIVVGTNNLHAGGAGTADTQDSLVLSAAGHVQLLGSAIDAGTKLVADPWVEPFTRTILKPGVPYQTLDPQHPYLALEQTVGYLTTFNKQVGTVRVPVGQDYY